MAEAYISLSGYKVMKGDWIEAESAFRKALELTTEPSSDVKIGITRFFVGVGSLKRAQDLLEEIRQNDPFNKDARAVYMRNLAFLGNINGAEQEYERVKALFGGQWCLGDSFITIIRLGADDVVSSDEIVYSVPIWDAAKVHLDSPEKGLAELRRIYTDNDNFSTENFMDISIWAAYFGDPGFAMEAMEKGISLNAAGLWHAWSPLCIKYDKHLDLKNLSERLVLLTSGTSSAGLTSVISWTTAILSATDIPVR